MTQKKKICFGCCCCLTDEDPLEMQSASEVNINEIY